MLMSMFSIDGAKLSGAQVWVALFIAAGVLGISVLRENKPAQQSSKIYEELITMNHKVDALGDSITKNTQAIHYQSDKINELNDDVKTVSSDMLILKQGVQKDLNELTEIGQYYIENKDSLDENQMKEVIDDWVKKNSWNVITGWTAY